MQRRARHVDCKKQVRNIVYEFTLLKLVPMRMSISIIGRLGVVGNASLADVSRMASVSVVSEGSDSSSVRDFCSQWFVNSYGREPVRVRRSKWMSRHRLGSVQ